MPIIGYKKSFRINWLWKRYIYCQFWFRIQ